MAYWIKSSRIGSGGGDGSKFVSFEALDVHTYQHELNTPDMIRENNAKIHISNALIDDAIGNVMVHLDAKGWLEVTDIIFTPDHGGMDGDNGLLLIGPAMIDSITRCTPSGNRPRA